MSRWFKPHQRVLVYPPGAGGEYIVTALTSSTGFEDVNTNLNKYTSGMDFPGSVILHREASKLPENHGEWTEECRLNFSDEMELKEFLKEKLPREDLWKSYVNNDPDTEEHPNPFPVAHYKTGNIESTMKPVWYPAHYDYNIFRAPVWWWLDYDNVYWNVHWSLCLKVKNENNLTITNEKDIEPLFVQFDVNDLHNWEHGTNRNIFRNYYNIKYPKSRISVDNEDFKEETNYIKWAERNLKVIKPFADKFRDRGNSKLLWEYLNDALPR